MGLQAANHKINFVTRKKCGARKTTLNTLSKIIKERCKHKIIKRRAGEEEQEVKVVVDNLSNFLSISPNQTKFLPSVCRVPAGLFCYFAFSLCGVFKKVINLTIAGFQSCIVGNMNASKFAW